jgi:hypothetical protein
MYWQLGCTVHGTAAEDVSEAGLVQARLLKMYQQLGLCSTLKMYRSLGIYCSLLKTNPQLGLYRTLKMNRAVR